jgi:aspartate/methionine/tyrosine aminotransferase
VKGKKTMIINLNELAASITSAGQSQQPEQALSAAVAAYRQIQEAVKRLEEYKRAAGAVVGDVLTEMGLSEYVGPEGWAYITAETDVTYYNAAGLDAAAAADAELAVKLAPFRKVTRRSGGVTVKAEKPLKLAA